MSGFEVWHGAGCKSHTTETLIVVVERFNEGL